MEVEQPQLGDLLTIIIITNHLLNGMILQVEEKQRNGFNMDSSPKKTAYCLLMFCRQRLRMES